MNTIRLSKSTHTKEDINGLAARVMRGDVVLFQAADETVKISISDVYRKFVTKEARLIGNALLDNESPADYVKKGVLKQVNRELKSIFDKYFSDEVSFTDIEKEIIGYIVNDAADNYTIAEMMDITESSVKVNLRRIMLKLGIKNRAQLIVRHYRGQINEKAS